MAMFNEELGKKKFKNKNKKSERDALREHRENLFDLKFPKVQPKNVPQDIGLPHKWQPSDQSNYSKSLKICGFGNNIEDGDLQKEVISLLNSIVRKQVSVNEIKSCQRVHSNRNVIIKFTTRTRREEVLKNRNAISNPYTQSDGYKTRIYIAEHFSPLADKLEYYAHQLKREGNIYRYSLNGGNVMIKVRKQDQWIPTYQITDFYKLFPNFKFSDGKKESEEVESDDEWKPPDHSTLEICGIPKEIEDVCLINEVVELLNSVVEKAVSLEEIKACRRTHSSGKVIVTFTTLERGQDVYRKRYMFDTAYTNGGADKSKIFINEHLSRKVGELAYHARELKRKKEIVNYSTGEESIRVKINNEESWIQINEMKDLYNHFPNFQFPK